MKIHKRSSVIAFTLLIIIILVVCYVVSLKLPMQELKITAITTAEEFDMAGSTDIYSFKSPVPGKQVTASIRFMAVENTSKNLFTRFGTGQYVYLGCDELHAEYKFIALGRFLHIRLKLNAAQTDLKLEDGTPFDITRYSLKPVLSIEE